MNFIKILRCLLSSEYYYNNMSDEELKEEREKLRQKGLVNGDSNLRKRMEIIDNLQIDRLNEKHRREHPETKSVYRENGWTLPEDDD